jgi:hypothetical protein
VDDCGNVWSCTLNYLAFPYKHFAVGGEWSKLVAARRVLVGETIKVGAKTIDPNVSNDTMYLMFNP